MTASSTPPVCPMRRLMSYFVPASPHTPPSIPLAYRNPVSPSGPINSTGPSSPSDTGQVSRNNLAYPYQHPFEFRNNNNNAVNGVGYPGPSMIDLI